jgi:dTDP-4-amino-4,6-dideoxygalactose transaminase
MRIPRYNYTQQFPQAARLMAGIQSLLLEGEYVLGPLVNRFEEHLAEYVGVPHAVGLNSGTDALVLALRALDIGPGDEVITVANTFHASVLAVTAVGARPILVDCRADDYLMDLDMVEKAVTSRTRAILAVHLFGKALDMDRVVDLAGARGLAVIEDCAQAIGARWRGARVGSFGQVGCFSFHPSKNLAAAGDAGAITTKDGPIAERVRILRGLGQRSQGEHVVRGYNTKLDALQALILDHKLPYLDGWNEDRRRVAERYEAGLRDSSARAAAVEGERHVFHLYQIAVPEHRDRIMGRLIEDGVDVVCRYSVPIHLQPAFADLKLGRAFPNAEYQAAHTLCLPVRPDLSSGEIDYVVEKVLDAVTERTSQRSGARAGAGS